MSENRKQNKPALKTFQRAAVSAIGRELAEALAESGSQRKNKIVLHSPTGSGKTRMISEIIKVYLPETLVLVLTPGKGNLHQQTQEALTSYLEDEPHVSVKDMTLENLAMDPQAGTVYVANWERLTTQNKQGDYTVHLTRESESSNLFDHIAKCGADIPVVVIIDEAHYGASKNAVKIQGFLKDLSETVKNAGGPEIVTLEASATPITFKGETVRRTYKVDTGEVVSAGLNRVAGVWNAGIDNGVLAEEESKAQALDSQKPAEIQKTSKAVFADVEELLLDKANERRKDLNTLMKAEGSAYNVLMAVQIPNSNLGVEAQSRVLDYFERQGITVDNGRLAIVTANTKTSDVEGLSSPDSPVDVLIYKQALDTGWNCPRAQILVGFRHIKSEIFSLQNIGRFRRTTEGYHYGNAELNKFYVYSNVTNSLDEYIMTQKGVDKDSSDMQISLEADKDKLEYLNGLELPSSRWKKKNQTPISSSTLRKALKETIEAHKHLTEVPFVESENISLRVTGDVDVSKFDSEESMKTLDGEGYVVSAGTKASQFRTKLEFLSLIKSAVVSTGDYGNNAKVVDSLAPVITSYYGSRVWNEGKTRNPVEVMRSFLASSRNRSALEELVVLLMETDKVQAHSRHEQKEGEVTPSYNLERDILEHHKFPESIHTKDDSAKTVPQAFCEAALYGMKTFYGERTSQWQESLSSPEKWTEKHTEEFLNNNPDFTLEIIHKNAPYSNGDNFSLALTIRVKDKNGKDAVTNFFPDYVMVFSNKITGASFPVILEVKDYTAEGRKQDPFVKNKVRAAEAYMLYTGIPFFVVGTNEMSSIILDKNGENGSQDLFVVLKERLQESVNITKAHVHNSDLWMMDLGYIED